MVPARVRIPSYAVWEFAVFVLNVLAFILVGFQLKAILARIDSGTLVRYTLVAAAVCLATIVARIVWVSGAAASVAGGVGRGRTAPSGRATPWASPGARRRWSAGVACGGS